MFSTEALPTLKWMVKINWYWDVMAKGKLRWFSHHLLSRTKRKCKPHRFPAKPLLYTEAAWICLGLLLFWLRTLKKYNVVLNSKTANNRTHSTTLKNQKAGLSRGEKWRMVFMEGSCQCPPSPQSVTDLHSEGRPSDRRHWARRCLNHFWRREICKITCHILANWTSLPFLRGSLCGPTGKECVHKDGFSHCDTYLPCPRTFVHAISYA